MIRTFEIEFPDDCGPLWLNTSNLLLCLTDMCRSTRFSVRDVTPDIDYNLWESSGPVNPARRENELRAVVHHTLKYLHTKNATYPPLDVGFVRAVAEVVLDVREGLLFI